MPLYFFSSNSIYFDQNKPIKVQIFETGSTFVKFLMPILKQQVNSSSNFASFFILMTHNSSVNFKLINFLRWIKGSQQSPNFETFKCFRENFQSSSCHFFPSSKPQISFLLKFCITFQCHERLLLCTFLAQKIYGFLKVAH